MAAIHDVAKIFNFALQAYDTYVRHSALKAATVGKDIIKEVYYVGWKHRLYDRALPIASGAGSACLTGLTAGVVTFVSGLSSVYGAAAVSLPVGIAEPAQALRKEIYDYFQASEAKPLSLLQMEYCWKLLATSVTVGAIAGTCSATKQLVSAWMKPSSESLQKPIFDDLLSDDIDDFMATIQIQKEDGGFLQNLLLYGPPGTGKTMVSKWIAHNSNMNYVIISGGNLVKSNSHLAELNNIFDEAEKMDTPTILFIDEAETFCRDRSKKDRSDLADLLNVFLHRTGEGSQKVIVILAVNRIDELDPAVLSRMDYKLFVGLPNIEERAKMIREFETRLGLKELGDAAIQLISEKTDGLSGRALVKLIRRVSVVQKIQKGPLTKETLLKTIDRFITREQEVAKPVL